MADSQIQTLIAEAISRQASIRLSEAQIQSLAENIAQQIAHTGELRQLPESVVMSELEPTIQIMLAQDHSSISDAAQFAVQVLVTQVSDDPAIVVPPQFQDANFCPYPGLNAFEELDCGMFFGRDLEIEYCARHLPQRFLAITGASGVGKSSLLQAGVVPHLRAAYGDKSTVILFRASSSSNFIAEFSATLSRELALPAHQIQHQLESSSDALSNLLRAICAEPDQRAFLIIDQFEELFVHETAGVQRCRFLDNLLSAAASPSLTSLSIILGSRKNFFEHRDYIARPILADALERSAISLDTLTDAQLREAIEQPLVKFNEAYEQAICYQSGLVDVIVDDFRNQSISLPLVQYLLRLLWVEKHRLSHFAYVSLGKLDRVLDRHASDIYHGFADEQKPRVDGILLSLVGVGLEGEHTRKRLPYEEIVGGAADEAVVRRLSAPSSRIISERTVNGVEYLELTHEVILREWTILRALVEANRERLQRRERLLVNADLWYSSRSPRVPNGDKGYLYQGTLYRQAKQYVESSRQPCSVDNRILECFAASRRQRRQNVSVMIGAVVAAAAIVGGIILGLQRQVADEQQRADLNATAQAVAQREAEVNATAQALAEAVARVNEYARATASAQAAAEQQAKEEARTVALSRQLAAASREALSRAETDTALLLSVEAYRRANTFEARSALLTGLLANPNLSKYLRSEALDADVLLAFSPDGRYLASGEPNGDVTLWDTSSATLVTTLHGAASSVPSSDQGARRMRTMGFDLQAENLFMLGETGGSVWNLSSYDLTSSVELNDFPSIGDTEFGTIAVDPSSGMIAVGKYDFNAFEGSVKIYEGGSGLEEPSQVITSPEISLQDGVTSLQFGPNGRILAIGISDRTAAGIGTLILWDVEVAQEVAAIALEFDSFAVKRVDCLALSNDYVYLAEAEAVGDPVVVIPVASVPRREENFFGPTNASGYFLSSALFNGCNLAVSPDNRFVATGNLALWDIRNPTALGRELGLNGKDNLYDLTSQIEDIESIAFSSDGQKLVASEWTLDGDQVYSWEIETGASSDSTATIDTLSGADPNLREIVDNEHGVRYKLIDSYDDPEPGGDRLELWDIATDQLIGFFETRAASLVLSPDGKQLVSYGFPSHAYLPHAAHIWDVDVESWLAKACQIANRSLNNEEWAAYLPDNPYRQTCDFVNGRP